MQRRYLTGFAAALALTLVPFGLVASGRLAAPATLAVIAVLGLVQVVIHLRYFLDLDLARTPRENLLALGFAALIIAVMIGGSLWIMIDLHARMAPA